MPMPDRFLFFFFWFWLGFSSVFTVLAWARAAAVESGRNGGGSARIRVIVIRVIVMIVGIAGMLGVARVWGAGMAAPSDLNAAAMWGGLLMALLFSYLMRDQLFRVPLQQPEHET